ncbi:hypothetical protein PVL29_009273 [Vitis rotundifolia]|uniref:Uncharacterized protein n=1 Tax=Vitis rotundifolia TaxID=103349 RepID=A0AA38ZXZ2_VITRO|nr:hypothetical protein PVL29_009273 [Vitis rotundifolia]
MQPNQLRTDEGSKEVVSLAGNNPSDLRNGLNGVVSANRIGGSAMENNSIEARKGIFLPQGLHQDQQQAPASGTYTSLCLMLVLLEIILLQLIPVLMKGTIVMWMLNCI